MMVKSLREGTRGGVVGRDGVGYLAVFFLLWKSPRLAPLVMGQMRFPGWLSVSRRGVCVSEGGLLFVLSVSFGLSVDNLTSLGDLPL